jgi:hypothetical protein
LGGECLGVTLQVAEPVAKALLQRLDGVVELATELHRMITLAAGEPLEATGREGELARAT